MAILNPRIPWNLRMRDRMYHNGTSHPVVQRPLKTFLVHIQIRYIHCIYIIYTLYLHMCTYTYVTWMLACASCTSCSSAGALAIILAFPWVNSIADWFIRIAKLTPTCRLILSKFGCEMKILLMVEIVIFMLLVFGQSRCLSVGLFSTCLSIRLQICIEIFKMKENYSLSVGQF